MILYLLLLFTFMVQSPPIKPDSLPKYFSGTGNYYQHISGSHTFEQARTRANKLSFKGSKGHLVTISSKEEDQFIRQAFNRYIKLFVGPWIGAEWDGSSKGRTGGWSWVTGEAFNYTGWNFKEPNHVDGIENAAHFSYGGWNDIYKERNNTVGFIVEYDKAVVVSNKFRIYTW